MMNGDIDKNESAVKESKGAAGTQIGVRYITEDLIRKLMKQEYLGHVTSLNLTLAKDNGKKIKYIENLESLRKLQVLNLSCNMIEKIEKLDKLSQLRELNVSFNSLTKIENLQTLTSLQILNMSGNQIEHIPNWLPKKLKALRTFRISKNNIESLQEFSKLRPLRDLTQLTVAENPVTQLPHCHAFVIFHLRTVNVLDGQMVTEEERNAAHSRFALEELESLTDKLQHQETAYHQLEEAHNKSLGELETCDRQSTDTHRSLKENAATIALLKQELDTKNDLLKKKTSQLTAACQKHYELEQEVAFYKIDHKFDSLARPRPLTPDGSDGVDDGLIGEESPYFGKGRYHKNMHARESATNGKGHAVPLTYGNVNGGRSAPVATANHEAMHATLDKELGEKRRAIEHAQDHLQYLQQELATTRDDITDASDELTKMAAMLTEDDKQALRDRLTNKMGTVHHLKREADQTEAEMQRKEDDIISQERGLGKLRGRLRHMGSMDSLYGGVKREAADRETQLELSTQQYHALQCKLEHMLATIARETIEMKNVEQELREGQVGQNEAMKVELETIIAGLQSYLTSVRHKSETQRDEYAGLVRDHEDLLEQLRDATVQRLAAEAQAEDASLLRERLAEAEVSLGGERQQNESLRQRVNESLVREEDEEEMVRRLQETISEMERLKAALNDTANRSQAERDNYERQMRDQHQQLKQAKDKARLANAREDEINNLHRTLADIQRANARLQDQVYALQQRDQTERNLNPEDLRKRLGALTRALHTGQTGEQGIQVGEDDPVGEALVELQDGVQRELDKSIREVERAHTERDNAEDAVHAMQNKYTESRKEERLMAEGVIQALIEEERREMTRMKNEIDTLRSQLHREWVAAQERPIPTRLLQPSKSTSTGSATSVSTSTSGATSSTDDTSTVLSSMWSEKRRQMYHMMTPDEQELFDELQREIEELRKLLGGKNKKVSDQVTQAERTVEKLLDKIASRRASDRTRSSVSTAASSSRGGDPRLQQAAKDLARSQEHIEFLQSKLRDYNHALDEGHDQERHTNAAHAEIDKLYDVLEEQRSEILHLNDIVGDLATHLPEQPRGRDEQLAALERDNTAMRDHLTNQQAPYQPGHGQQAAPPFNGYFDRAACHQTEGPQPYQPVQPNHPGSHIGRPVPTFYGVEGQVIGPPHSDPHYGVDTTDHGQSATGYEHGAPQAATQYGFAPDGGQPGGVSQSNQRLYQGDQHHFQPNQQQFLPNQQQYQPNQQQLQPNQQQLQPNIQQYQPQLQPNQQPNQQQLQPNVQQFQPNQQPYTAAPRGFTVPPTPGQPLVLGQPLQQGNAPQVAFVSPAAPQYLVSPTAPQYLVSPAAPQFLVSTPTTPIAGPGQVFLQATPDGMTTQPVMYSTPVSPAPEVVGGPRPVKGILKKTRNDAEAELEEHLVCNVPQHHHLEDFVYKLQEKIHALQSQLGQYQETSASSSDDSRHVLFVDDVERKALKKLQAELKERRAELETLDLAVGRQKSQLQDMKGMERELLAKREDTTRELRELKRLNNKKTRPQRRKEFLDGATIYNVDESDYVYEHDPRSHRPRRDLVNDEIKCLEATLAKRRAELRESDRLLLECEADLVEARKEAKLNLRQHEETRSSLKSAISDSEEIERRAYDAGVTIVRAEDQLRLMQRQNAELKTTREETEKMLSEIEMVIARKNEEFQHVDVKLRSATQRLLEVEMSLARVDSERTEKLSLAQESDDLVSTRRSDLNALTQQITASHEQVEHLNHVMGRSRAELQLLQETVEKRRKQLDSLDTQLEQEIASRRLEIKVVEDRLTSLQTQTRREEQNINWTQDESQLDGLSGEVRQRTTELERLKVEMERSRAELVELGVEKTAAETTNEKLKWEKAQLDEIQRSLHGKIRQLKRAEQQIGERVRSRRSRLDNLDSELRHIETALGNGRERKGVVDRELTTVRASVHEHTGELEQLHTSLQEAESQVELLEQVLKTINCRFAHVTSELATKENELHNTTERLGRAKMEAERQQKTEENFVGLEEKVQNLATEIATRDTEKEELMAALSRSCEELTCLRTQVSMESTERALRIQQLEDEVMTLRHELEDREQEIRQIREKSAAEFADLEGIAQAHYSRANRLGDELNYLRAEHLEITRRLQSQEEISDRDHKLEDTLRELKDDIKTEVTESMLDLERSRVGTAAELELLHDQKDHLGEHLTSLKHSLVVIRSGTNTPVPQESASKGNTNYFEEQQDLLKREIHQKMSRHAEAMETQRQDSRDSIQQLQRKLNNLEQVLCPSDPHRSTTPSSEIMFNRSQTPTPARDVQENDRPHSEGPYPKRAYSPHRHSNQRIRSAGSASNIAEKGPSS